MSVSRWQLQYIYYLTDGNYDVFRPFILTLQAILQDNFTRFLDEENIFNCVNSIVHKYSMRKTQIDIISRATSVYACMIFNLEPIFCTRHFRSR